MTPTSQREGSWVERHTAAWVDAGIITDSQREAIREFEGTTPAPAGRRLTVVAEVASYLGSVIAGAGGAAIIAPSWSELGTFVRFALAAVIATSCFVGGTLLVRIGEPGAVRLGSFLWVVASAGVALGVGVLADDLDTAEPANVALAVGTALAVCGFGLWRGLDRPLQLVTGVAGLGVMWTALAELTEMPSWMFAVTVWCASVGFGVVAAVDRLRPRSTALVVAAVGAMTGALTLGDLDERLGSIVAVGTAGAIVVFGLVDQSLPIVGVGVLAFVVATSMLMGSVLEGTAARLGVVAVGLLVVGATAVRAQRRARSDQAPLRRGTDRL